MFRYSLKIAVEPQQDLHGYDSPWVGGAGKNKLQNTLNSSQGVTVNDDGSVVLNGTFASTVWPRIITNITLKAGTYTLSGTPQGAPEGCYIYDDGTFGGWTDTGSGSTKTFENDTTGSIMIRVPNGTYNNVKFYPMIEVGSQKTSYAPYSNICPIIGWSAVDVNVRGENWFDKTKALNAYLDGSITIRSNDDFKSVYVELSPNTNYTYKQTEIGNYKRFGLCNSLEEGTRFFMPTSQATAGFIEATEFTFNSNNFKYLVCTIYRQSVDTKTFDEIANSCMFNIGSTATAYEPYNGSTITIQLGDTYYGGKLDVVSGVLSAVPYYASYNGETLVGEWISDRDKYEVGTTPTIGAQVVNIGATPIEVQLTPTAVSSLLGQNNLWADTGDVLEASYFESL